MSLGPSGPAVGVLVAATATKVLVGVSVFVAVSVAVGTFTSTAGSVAMSATAEPLGSVSTVKVSKPGALGTVKPLPPLLLAP
jgi:hypothetical protein